jgi:hypothetical protein
MHRGLEREGKGSAKRLAVSWLGLDYLRPLEGPPPPPSYPARLFTFRTYIEL